MTREHKINKLIAEKVFGWTVVDRSEYRDGSLLYFIAPVGTCGKLCMNHEHMLPDFATDRYAAMSVVEEIGLRFCEFNLLRDGNGWHARFGKYGCSDAAMPLAVCGAALHCFGVIFP